MNKEKYLQSKLQAFEGNIQKHGEELGLSPNSLFEHVGTSYLDKQAAYEDKNFESTERLVGILNSQSIIRGTQHIFHRLHQLRNETTKRF